MGGQSLEEEAFWSRKWATYSLAAGPKKRPCRIRSSNAAHWPFHGDRRTGPGEPCHADDLSPGFLLGGGCAPWVQDEAKCNPLSYHNGSIWPHDNALIAMGPCRYGETRAAGRLLAGLFDAGQYFELDRMPELFAASPGTPASSDPLPCRLFAPGLVGCLRVPLIRSP